MSRKSVSTPVEGTPRSGWRGDVAAIGPGLITGASDDDPSGIATYAQVGAKFRFDMAWSALLTLPLMGAVQEICDRTALATGKGLGDLFRQRFTGKAKIAVSALMLL